MSFIAYGYSDAKLLPFGDPVGMGKAYEMLSWFATNLHVAIAQMWRTERFTDDDSIKESLKASGTRNFQRTIAAFNGISAAGGPYLLGDRFSVVDGLAPMAARWMKRVPIEPAQFPSFNALVARIESRPAYARAIERESAKA